MSRARPNFRVYLITDRRSFAGEDAIEGLVEEAVKGGVRAVQLREKDMPVRELLGLSRRMRDLTGKYSALLFINDRVDVALAVGADGVHLGGQGIPVEAVRRICGDRLMIGVSTHSPKEARAAEAGGADFITFGPVYETPSKAAYGPPLGVETLREAAGTVGIPVFAIGGIKRHNMGEAVGAGAHGVALISAILGAADVRAEAEAFVKVLG